MNVTELLGTISSVVVAISLMMKNILWLRWVNLVGATLFSVYGFLIQAWPVFGLNAFIVFINAVYLAQLSSTQDQFTLLEVPASDAQAGQPTLLSRFLAFHGPDLARFQPDFPRSIPEDARVFFVLRELLPVSLFICRPDGKGNQEIMIDYAVPAWRDFQNARFVFQDGLRALVWPGTGTFFTHAPVASHARYLKKLGFQRVDGQPETWKWTLGDRRPAG